MDASRKCPDCWLLDEQGLDYEIIVDWFDNHVMHIVRKESHDA